MEDSLHAKQQAQSQLEYIKSMMARLEHCNSGCNNDEGCSVTHETIINGIDGYYTTGMIATQEQIDQYHDIDDCTNSIQEHPLCVEIRSDWYTPGNESDNKPYEFNILLCTGGPACRLLGNLDNYQQPTRAYLQYQDWGTPWTDYICDSNGYDALLQYAQQFCFGE